MSTAIMSPTDPLAQLALAQKQLADRAEAGRRSMIDAWVGEPGRVPTDLESAAQAIKRIRLERDAAKIAADNNAKAAAEATSSASATLAATSSDVRAMLAGNGVASNSPLAPVVARMAGMQDEIAAARSELESFRRRVQTTFTEASLGAHPTLAGYFTGQSPLLASAEAAAVFMGGDRVAKEAYLRRRGWRLTNGAWREPGEDDRSLWPFDTAVLRQVKADTAPFKHLGDRDYVPPKASHDREVPGAITETPAAE